MKNIKITFLLLLIGEVFTVKAQILTLVDSVQLSNAQIWGVSSDDGDSLCVTTIFTPSVKPHMFMRKIDYTDISQQSSPKQLTFDSDFASITNLTDHKSLVLNNEIYVTFSTQGDQGLYIFKTDINGNRIGNIVPVIEGSNDPTNDMILVTDGTYIFVLHFDPPNQHHVYKFDGNLNPVGSPFSTTTLAHNNIGNAIYLNNEFCMFTGSTFGFTANLTLTKWSNSWSPTIGTPQTILSTSNGDGNWFSTGVVYDSSNQRWYIGMNHISSTETIGDEHIDLLVLDSDFNLLERQHITTINYTRPHFVLKSGYLYMTYDRPGVGVYMHKYQVEITSGFKPMGEINELELFPNPVNDIVNINNSGNKNQILTLSNIYGQKIDKVLILGNTNFILNLENKPSGLYFLHSELGSSYKLIKK